jgi:hypothetical protein
VSAGNDKVLRFWDLQSDRDAITLAIRGPRQWAAIDRAGRFDAPLDSGDAFVWVVRDEPIDLDQLSSRYYSPGRLGKFLANDEQGLLNVSGFADPALFPAIATHGLQNGRVEITLTDRGGGFGAVPVHINGRELTADARTLPENSSSRPVNGQLRLTVDVHADPRLTADDENHIDVYAFEKENYLRSRAAGIRITPVATGTTAPKPARLWVVAAGVSDYAATELNLKYAAKDAYDIGAAFLVGAEHMFGSENTKVTVLASGQKDPKALPTRQNLLAALKELLGSAHDDVVVVYLSGHGVSLGHDKGDYYFLTADASSDDLQDPEVRKRSAISGDELADIMKRIPAEKRVVILDTCSAGAFMNVFGKSRGLTDSQLRAMRRLHERTGFHILAGSAADKPSWEASPYSQGLLTYCLLFGMSGGALDHDRYVNVLDLFDFADREVPILAEGIHGVQSPLHDSPGGGMNFPIGQVLLADVAKIPIQNLRPVFVETQFQEETKYRDSLHLSALVDMRLRAQAEPDSASGRSSIMFVAGTEYPRALQVIGRYAITEPTVTVSAIVFRDGTEVDHLSLVGSSAKPEEIADRMTQDLLTAAGRWK